MKGLRSCCVQTRILKTSPRSKGSVSKSLSKQLRKKSTYVGLGAEGMVDAGWLEKDFDCVVVDAPRKGCSPPVLNAINGSTAKEMRGV